MRGRGVTRSSYQRGLLYQERQRREGPRGGLPVPLHFAGVSSASLIGPGVELDPPFRLADPLGKELSWPRLRRSPIVTVRRRSGSRSPPLGGAANIQQCSWF